MKNATNIVRHYSEIDQFLATPYNRGTLKFSEDFEGYNSFEEMKDEIKKGIQLDFESNTFEISNNMIQDVAGFMPIIPDYLQGRPDCMFNFETVTAPRYYELNIYISLQSDVEAHKIRRQGEILKAFVKDNFAPTDRIKITFTNMAEDCHELGNTSNKLGDLTMTVIFSDFNDYITPELWALICSPAAYRIYMLKGRSIGFVGQLNYSQLTNGTPVSISSARRISGVNYIGFMNMAEDLENWAKLNLNN